MGAVGLAVRCLGPQRPQGRPADRFLTVPDADDPADLEFYSGNGFWYHDRAYMTVLNYAASPLALRQHGPHLDNEWWTSRDGLRWERLARGVNALAVFPQIPRLETHPLVVNGTILFPRGNLLLGLPEDRISYITAGQRRVLDEAIYDARGRSAAERRIARAGAAFSRRTRPT